MNCTLNIEDYMNRITTSIDNLEYNINDNKIYYKSGITDDYMTKKDWLDKVKEHMNNHFAKKIPKLGYSDDVFKVITETIDNKFIPYIEYSPNNNSKKIIEEYVNDFYEPKIDKTESDVKKELRLYNEVNESNIPLILSRLKKYNQSSGTKHRIEFKKIGESQRYKSNLILNFNNIEDVKKEKEKQKRVEEARAVQREDAKRAGVEYDDNYLKDLEDRFIFTEKDRQIRMNFANLTNLIKNNDIRVLDLKAEDNKISNFTKADIQGLENYADIIPDISRERALEELANIENIDDPGVFYVTSYLAQVFIDRLVDSDGLLGYGFRTPKEGGIATMIRPKLRNIRIVITKNNLKDNPFYQYNNAVVIGLKQLNDFVLNKWSLEQLETIVRTVADEEAIHLITEEVTTQEDIDKIYSELSEADIKEIKDIYGSESLSKEGVVYEYLRMVVQNKIFGTTTEIEVAKITQTVMDVLRKLIKRLIGFLTTRAPGNFTQTIINDIYNFTKGNISEELASKIENKVYKGVVVEANINRVKQGVAELFESNPELANSVYSKILTNSDISAENLLSLLEQENIIEKDCSGGKLKAKDGIRSKFTKGSQWEIVKDLGSPKFKKGGIWKLYE
jgi:hypothetical protein